MKEFILILLSISTFQFSQAVVCTKPWTFSHGNSCYYFGLNPDLSFGEARIQCMEYGGHLVSFETKEEEAFVGAYLHQHHIDFRYYIGATDFGTEGYWYWVHSGQNLTFTNWKVNEPRGRFYENCAWKLGIGVQYKWIDISCAEPAAYLCEKDGK